jgi:hypothetical protein
MEFRVSRDARDQYRFDEGLFSVRGDAVFADPLAARRFAQRMVAAGGSRADRPVQAGDIDAMGLIHEIQHLAVARSAARLGDRPFADVLQSLATELQPGRLDATLGLFEGEFPAGPVYAGAIAPREHLDGTTDGLPNREVSLEELLLLWVANQNPAFMGYSELFDDASLETASDYGTVVQGLRRAFARRAEQDPGGEDLVERLLMPARVSPASLTEQLRWIRATAVVRQPRSEASVELPRSPSVSAPIATGCQRSCSWQRAPTYGSTSCRAATAGRSGRWTAFRTRSSPACARRA